MRKFLSTLSLLVCLQGTAGGPVALGAGGGMPSCESIEGRHAVVIDALVVGPTHRFRQTAVVPDGGRHPERILLNSTPMAPGVRANVGDRLEQVAGVVDCSHGKLELRLTQPPVLRRGGLRRETTRLRGDADRLTVASFNVDNLDPGDGRRKFRLLARQVARHLRAPDIVVLQEVQDNNGTMDDGVVDASATLAMLVDAIRRAGGPPYAWRQIDPRDNEDGGEPGGNIRLAMLFNPARVHFVDRPAGAANEAVAGGREGSGLRLSRSPGRIAPAHPAFTRSRKPLAGEFGFN